MRMNDKQCSIRKIPAQTSCRTRETRGGEMTAANTIKHWAKTENLLKCSVHNKSKLAHHSHKFTIILSQILGLVHIN